jgi:hypothetical protein
MDSTDVLVNGTHYTMDTTPREQPGRVLVPTRFVTENLGALVDWNGPTGRITISR